MPPRSDFPLPASREGEEGNKWGTCLLQEEADRQLERHQNYLQVDWPSQNDTAAPRRENFFLHFTCVSSVSGVSAEACFSLPV